MLLTMGHDGSPARLVWLDASDRTAPYLPEPQNLPTYKAQQRLFDKLGARHVHLPLWRPLPLRAAGLTEGPTPSPTVTTVHPLGGCVMGDRPEDGVVDDLGRVWVHDAAAPEIPPAAIEPASDGDASRLRPHRYLGLHVLDGSIVPTALGCNPLLTITALAERALDAIPGRQDHAPVLLPAHMPRRAAPAAPSPDLAIDATLNETLFAEQLRLHGKLARALGRKCTTARLDASFPTDDLPAMLTGRRHPLQVQATLWLDATVLRHGRDVDEPVVYKASAGELMLLPAHWSSSGAWPFVATVSQFVVVAGCTVCAHVVGRLGARARGGRAGRPAAAGAIGAHLAGEEPQVRLRYRCRERQKFVTWRGDVQWKVHEALAVRMVWADVRLPANDAPEALAAAGVPADARVGRRPG